MTEKTVTFAQGVEEGIGKGTSESEGLHDRTLARIKGRMQDIQTDNAMTEKQLEEKHLAGVIEVPMFAL